MLNKLKALIQWFMLLELQEHKHWCTFPKGYNDGSCEHMTGCWYCTGLFCAGIERKDCPNCVQKKSAKNNETVIA